MPPAAATLAPHGLTLGVFDLFHVGHLRYLQYARARSRRLTVLVASDATVRDRKQRSPVFPEAERLELVRGLGWVDAAQLLPQSTDYPEPTLALFAALAPTHVFVGGDWQGSARWERLIPPLAGLGVAVVFVPRTAAVSTSELRRRIRAGSGA